MIERLEQKQPNGRLVEREGAIVTLATAHAAKFPETVEQALGIRPGLPDRVGDLYSRPERFEVGPMSLAFVQDRIERVVRAKS